MDSTQAGPVGSDQPSAEQDAAVISESQTGKVNNNPAAGNEPQVALYPSPVLMNRLRHHCLPMLQLSAQDMSRLEIEIKKSKTTWNLNLPSTIFPDSSLPFPVNPALLLSMPGIWDPRNKKLKPPMNLTAALVRDWLNEIARTLGSVTEKIPTRTWGLNCLKSSEAVDCLLFGNPIDPPTWANVKAVAEVTSHPKLHTEIKKIIQGTPHLHCSTQPPLYPLPGHLRQNDLLYYHRS
jgi:hypothetical protein